MLEGKLLYRESCIEKNAWDAPLSEEATKKWKKWERSLPETVSVRRSIPLYQEEIDEIQLHAFGDASGRGVCAAVYTVVKQVSGLSQGLVTAKSRLAKPDLTIPRLELVSGHMAVNLIANVRQALEGLSLATNDYCWLDSSVALHWIADKGEYRQFVQNRVSRIQSHPNVLWRHVPSTDNPADLGSRGGSVVGAKLWWDGPTWLSEPVKWPDDIMLEPSPESIAERKLQQEVFAVGVKSRDEFDLVLWKFELRKAVRIGAWVMRFLHNSRNRSSKTKGPLTTAEVEKCQMFLVKRAQLQGTSHDKFDQDQEQLNLQPGIEGVLECRGRIQGKYPIYLPDSALLAAKIVQRAHATTLHGGVSLTMASVREKFWIPVFGN